MRKIYILLSRTGTLPSRMIHLSLGGLYTHASIAITPETNKLYSFARRTLHNPLNAGFMLEDTKTHVFAVHQKCNCAVYSIEISDDAYANIEKVLKRFVANPKRFGYNFLGVIPSRLGIPWNRKHHFTCSQFVAYVLHVSGGVKLPKEYSLMMPNDFLDIVGMKLVYSGKIRDCKIEKEDENVDISSISEQV